MIKCYDGSFNSKTILTSFPQPVHITCAPFIVDSWIHPYFHAYAYNKNASQEFITSLYAHLRTVEENQFKAIQVLNAVRKKNNICNSIQSGKEYYSL